MQDGKAPDGAGNESAIESPPLILSGSGNARSQVDLQVSLGFNGQWKLGQVCPVRVTLPSDNVSAIEVQTVDGDGVQLTYRQLVLADQNLGTGDHAWVSVRIGRQLSTLRVRVLDAEGAVLAERGIEASGLPSDQPMIVALGSSMGVEDLNRSNAEDGKTAFTETVLSSANELPPTWRDYSGCDVILISCRDKELLQNISAKKWQAIDGWIRRGGGCVISLGGVSSNELQEVNTLDVFHQMLPGKVVGVGQISDPGVLESLVATDDPIPRFSATLIDVVRGKVELAFSDSLSRSLPWWISYAHGSGTIRLIASDLDAESFAEWRDRKLLWEKLLESYFERSMMEEVSSVKQSSDSSYLGYSDLVGQLRATLDVFPTVKVVSFGQVAAILMGVLFLIGPVDYFVSVKWLKRPDLSWYIAGISLFLVSLGLTFVYNAHRPDEIRVNTAQVIDVDAETGAVNGWLWSHVYSGKAHKVNLTTRSAEDDTKVPASDARQVLDWQGLPGKGLGGLLSQLNTDRGMPAYQLQIQPTGQSEIRAVGIPAAGTKCLSGSWTDQVRLAGESRLQEIAGVDQLSGELVNPLDVDLKDAMLFYHNWFYLLNSRIPAKSTVAISFDTIPKDIARRLNERRRVDGNDSITRWNPAGRNSIDRLLELMMFHKAASGRSYTSLAHRFQPHLDHSNLLDTDRAILVGRIETPPISIVVECEDDPDVTVFQDLNRVWCRLVIPVQKQAPSRN